MMRYINPILSESGAYPPIQDTYAPSLLEFPEEFMSVFYPADKEFAGFVTIEDDGEQVISCAWNEEAYQAYVANLPEPEPIPEPKPSEVEQLRADVDYIAVMTGVEL